MEIIIFVFCIWMVQSITYIITCENNFDMIFKSTKDVFISISYLWKDIMSGAYYYEYTRFGKVFVYLFSFILMLIMVEFAINALVMFVIYDLIRVFYKKVMLE